MTEFAFMFCLAKDQWERDIYLGIWSESMRVYIFNHHHDE